MKFGKIDYLNLLPFHVFLKKSPLQSYVKKAIEHKKGVPARLNNALLRSQIDAAVISSIESRRTKYKKLNFGIVAGRGAVKSVLVRKNSKPSLDAESASSNMLARVLGLKGEVIIGDKALKVYIADGAENFHDLGAHWRSRTGLNFVFARFCYTKNGEIYSRLSRAFLRENIKIPAYIMQHYSRTRNIAPDTIKWYLQHITYKIGKKELKSLKIFLNRAREFGYNARQE